MVSLSRDVDAPRTMARLFQTTEDGHKALGEALKLEEMQVFSSTEGVGGGELSLLDHRNFTITAEILQFQICFLYLTPACCSARVWQQPL